MYIVWHDIREHVVGQFLLFLLVARGVSYDRQRVTTEREKYAGNQTKKVEEKEYFFSLAKI